MKNVHQVEVTWALPPLLQHYRLVVKHLKDKIIKITGTIIIVILLSNLHTPSGGNNPARLLTIYRKKPLNYLGFLLGHEGKRSMLSYLKKR